MSLLGYLAERERIEQGATPGPWIREEGRFSSLIVAGKEGGEIVADLSEPTEANGPFIADARTAVPTLIAMLREATEALKEIERGGEVRDIGEIAFGALEKIERMAKP